MIEQLKERAGKPHPAPPDVRPHRMPWSWYSFRASVGAEEGMRRLGPSARFVSAVAALTVLGVALPASAGQAETALPSVAVDDGDHSSESSGDPGTTRVRRTVRSPIRDPWSAGVRVLWRSLGGKPGGGVALPPTAGGSPPVVLGSCSASGSCSPDSVRRPGGALGTATTGNGLPVQGVAFDAGRLISTGVEVGIGLDLTTHPGQALLSTGPGVGFRNAPPEDTALQVLPASAHCKSIWRIGSRTALEAAIPWSVVRLSPGPTSASEQG